MISVLDLAPGQTFAGQFRIIQPLAKGGMGAVYVVEQLSTGKRRALKLMLPAASAIDGERRFEQEARTSSLIPSEHVVDVIAAGVEGPDRVPWLVMELLEGESLEAYLNRNESLALVETYDILQQLSHALSAAHDIGVVHRDLKPDNIFLARARTVSGPFLVKVLDFGLAKVVDAATKNTAAMGTPLWMAPEQTQADELISCATDVWAFGLIAFRLVSGRYYWRSYDGALTALLREILIEPLAPASVRAREAGGRELPPGFDEWFARCVARQPTERFQHCREAWQELSSVLLAYTSGVPVRSVPAPARSPSMPPLSQTIVEAGSAPLPRRTPSGGTQTTLSPSSQSGSTDVLAKALDANAASAGKKRGKGMPALIALAVLGGLGAVFALRQAPPPAADPEPDATVTTPSAAVATGPAVAPVAVPVDEPKELADGGAPSVELAAADASTAPQPGVSAAPTAAAPTSAARSPAPPRRGAAGGTKSTPSASAKPAAPPTTPPAPTVPDLL